MIGYRNRTDDMKYYYIPSVRSGLEEVETRLQQHSKRTISPLSWPLLIRTWQATFFVQPHPYTAVALRARLSQEKIIVERC